MTDPASAEGSALFWRLIIMAAALSASFFFSASEFAVIRLDRLKIRNEVDHGDKRAGILLRFLENAGRFLSSIAIGNTFANLLLSSFVAVTFAEPLTNWLIKVFGATDMNKETVTSVATVIVTVVITYLVLVCGEITPKQFAISKGEVFARRMSRALRGWSLLVSPVVWLVDNTARFLLRFFGIKQLPSAQVDVNEEQILMQVEYGEQHGAIETDEKEMIQNVFELNDLTAADVMVHRKDVVALPITTTPKEVQDTIRETNFSRIPIYKENIDNVIGVLNSRDILLRSLDGSDFSIEPLIRTVLFVPETLKADVLLKRMQNRKQSLAIVVDDHGGTSGIVSIQDLLTEIVGDLYDEYDTETDELHIVNLPDGSWRVPGEATIDDVNADVGTELVEGEFNTLGGYIIERLGSVPTTGTIVNVPELNLRMMVEKMDGHRVDSVIIQKVEPAPQPEEAAEADEDEEETSKDGQ